MTQYRIRESRGVYYPEKRFLGILWKPLYSYCSISSNEILPQGYFNIEKAQEAIDYHYQEIHRKENKFHHYNPTENQ